MKKLPIYRKKLSNGLDVIVMKNGSIPSISINLTYRVGSKDEKIGRRGFAHLFEHLMFEGSKNLPKGEFDKLCSLAGGSNNAYTSYDWTSYIMTLPSTQLELGIWLEAERMFNFEITDASLQNQQKVVTEEIRQVVEDQPYGKWRDLLAETAFHKDCSYSWEVHGSIDDVRDATMDDVLEFKKNFYNPANASLVIVGDVEKTQAYELIEKYFDKPNGDGKIPRNSFKEEYKIGGKNASYQDVVPHDAVFIGFHFPGLTNEEYIVGEILSNIIGHGKSAFLNNKLVYRDQIASYASSFADKREHTSILTFLAIASTQDISTDVLYNAILEQVDKAANSEIDKDTLIKTRNQLKTSHANELMYSSGLADSVGKMAMLYDDPEKVFTFPDLYDKVTIDDIEKFAKKYLKPENSVRIDVLHG